MTQIGPVGTGAASASVLGLHTAETTIVVTDQMGRIEFKAPSEADGTDAILVTFSFFATAMAITAFFGGYWFGRWKEGRNRGR